jgi:Neuraminidase (sialidase)
MKSIYSLVLLYISLFFISTTLPQIADITRLPVQNPEQSITESTPVLISDTEILIFYTSEDKDTIYSTRTTNSGVTWQELQFVISGYDFFNASIEPIYISSLRTSSGRILLSVVQWLEGILVIYSDDNGYTWSDAQLILGGGGNIPLQRNSLYNVNISELNNGKIILSFNTASGSVSFFRESINDGETWSEEAFVFYESSNSATGFRDVSMISGSTNEVIAFFENNDGDDTGIYKRMSADGGNTWSDTIRIVNGPLRETHPRILKDDSGKLWLFYLIENESGYSNYRQNDVYILKSTDGGLTWIENKRFTKYVGDDNYIRISNYNNNMFLSFATERFTNDYHHQKVLRHPVIHQKILLHYLPFHHLSLLLLV